MEYASNELPPFTYGREIRPSPFTDQLGNALPVTRRNTRQASCRVLTTISQDDAAAMLTALDFADFNADLPESVTLIIDAVQDQVVEHVLGPCAGETFGPMNHLLFLIVIPAPDGRTIIPIPVGYVDIPYEHAPIYRNGGTNADVRVDVEAVGGGWACAVDVTSADGVFEIHYSAMFPPGVPVVQNTGILQPNIPLIFPGRTLWWGWPHRMRHIQTDPSYFTLSTGGDDDVDDGRVCLTQLQDSGGENVCVTLHDPFQAQLHRRNEILSATEPYDLP